MAVTAEKIVTFARGILGDDPNVPKLPVEKYLEAIPRLNSLADLPSGTPVLIRGDVDAKPGAKVGEGDIRLRSMKGTLDYARQKGWKIVIFGHIGREPEKSLSKVRTRLGGDPRLRSGLHRRLARSGNDDDQGRGCQGDPKRRAGQRDHAGKHAEIRRRARCSGRPSRPTCPSWPIAWPSWPMSSPRRWPRSISTRPFRPAASMRRA